jgi:hypothetical protein
MGLVNSYITYNILMSKEIRDINCYHEDEFIEFINKYFELHYIESDGTRYRYHLIDGGLHIFYYFYHFIIKTFIYIRKI